MSIYCHTLHNVYFFVLQGDRGDRGLQGKAGDPGPKGDAGERVRLSYNYNL